MTALLGSLLAFLASSAVAHDHEVAADEHHDAEDSHDASHVSIESEHGATHRAIGIKLIDLNAMHEGRPSAWIGAGMLVELPLSRTVVVEVAVQGLAGTRARPGLAIPVDLLAKRVWLRDRWVVTAGGGPSLTWMSAKGERDLFPGVLTSLGGSYWFGEHLNWGVLAEVDVGAALEHGVVVPELELATGVVFSL